MRLMVLLLTALFAAAPLAAQAPQPAPASSAQDSPSAAKDVPALNLPISMDKIRGALVQEPVLSLRTIDEGTIFRVQIRERQRLEELLATLNFKTSPAPAGGLYGAEMQRVMFPSVNDPMHQPYAAFNQPELLTILVENLAGSYLGGHAIDTITKASRARALAAAREDVRAAIAQYCSAQPNGGAGIQMCDSDAK